MPHLTDEAVHDVTWQENCPYPKQVHRLALSHPIGSLYEDTAKPMVF